jgi:hypothetical protein
VQPSTSNRQPANLQPAILPPPAQPLTLISLSLALLLPSSGVAFYYASTPGLLLYLLMALPLIWRLPNHILPPLLAWLTPTRTRWLAALTFAALLLLFALLYPLANAAVLGQGSDRDEALNLAATELLHGRYPYYPRTYLFNNPISPLPGAVLLATPFVILGNSAYQNFFWLLAFFLVAARQLRDQHHALLLLWTILALSPLVIKELINGSDLLANPLYVLVAILLSLEAANKPARQVAARLAPALFLGLALSSRANFLFLLPLLLSALKQRAGWPYAIRFISLTLLTFALVTLPFYLYDPQGFSPLHTANILRKYNTLLPHADLLVLGSTLLAAALLARQPLDHHHTPTLLHTFAIVQAIPILTGLTLSALISHTLDYHYVTLTLNFLFFGALAAWSQFTPPSD